MAVRKQDSVRAILTVGVPLCNSGNAVSAVLRNIQAQTYRGLSVIVSDNASSDDTRDHLRQASPLDIEIRVRYQPERLNAFAHFRRLISECETEYFALHAHDDAWNERFLEDCVEALAGNPQATLAVPSVRTLPTQLDTGKKSKTPFSATENYSSPRMYLRTVSHNSAFYGVFRSGLLKQALRGEDTYWGSDIVTIARLLSRGPAIRVPTAVLARGLGGESARRWRNLNDYNRTIPGFIFPLWPMTYRLLRELPEARRSDVLAHLVWRNIRSAISAARHRSSK
jgi:GT2 family glycosyltransferase